MVDDGGIDDGIGCIGAATDCLCCEAGIDVGIGCMGAATDCLRGERCSEVGTGCRGGDTDVDMVCIGCGGTDSLPGDLGMDEGTTCVVGGTAIEEGESGVEPYEVEDADAARSADR